MGRPSRRNPTWGPNPIRRPPTIIPGGEGRRKEEGRKGRKGREGKGGEEEGRREGMGGKRAEQNRIEQNREIGGREVLWGTCMAILLGWYYRDRLQRTS